MKNKFKRIIITTGALLMMTMAPITQSNPLGQYLNEMSGVITAQAAELNQSPRWHADSNGVWYLKNEAGTGNVVNSWFQDLDGSWYLLAPNDGHMYAGLIHDTLTDKWYYCQTEHVVLCQEKVQIKSNQFSLCLAKLNLLFLSHYLLDFSDILPHIGLGINTRNGCEYVLYCKMFLCIQKSTYMHVYN